MTRILLLCSSLFAGSLLIGQVQRYVPVTQQMLENPSPDDWLMFSRTYDAQRFSPLKQITKQNVGQLHLAWERGMGAGQTETIPIVHNGVMYVVIPARSCRRWTRPPAICCGSTSATCPPMSPRRDAPSRWRSTRTSSPTPRRIVS